MLKAYKNQVFILLNCIVPLLVGLLIYILFRSDTYIHRVFYSIGNINSESISPILDNKNFIINFLRYYLVDGLWCYALIFALVAFTNKISIIKIVISGFLAFFFGTIFEVLQLKHIVGGTFDWLDLLMYLIASILAVLINIKKLKEKV